VKEHKAALRALPQGSSSARGGGGGATTTATSSTTCTSLSSSSSAAAYSSAQLAASTDGFAGGLADLALDDREEWEKALDGPRPLSAGAGGGGGKVEGEEGAEHGALNSVLAARCGELEAYATALEGDKAALEMMLARSMEFSANQVTTHGEAFPC